MKKILLLAACLLTLPVMAIDIGAYKYYPREKLYLNLRAIYEANKKKNPDKPLQVKIVDELIRVWDSQKLEEGWVRFDTKYFRCIIQKSNSGEDAETGYPKGYDLLQQIHDYQKDVKSGKKMKETLFDKKTAWKYYGLVAIYAKVEKSSLWGKVAGDSSKENGVEPEQIVLVVEDVRVPRERFQEYYPTKPKEE